MDRKDFIEIVAYSPEDDDIWRFRLSPIKRDKVYWLHAETPSQTASTIVTSLDKVRRTLKSRGIIILQEQEY